MTSWMDLVRIPVGKDDKEDVAGLEASKAIIHAQIDSVVASGTPSEKIVIGGFSQGGAMALYAGYSYPAKLAGVVSFSGWAAQREGFHARVAEGANAKTPCFMGHGTEDNVVLPECGEDAKTRFEAAGVPVNFSTYRMPHSTCGAEMRAVREFLREVLQLG